MEDQYCPMCEEWVNPVDKYGKHQDYDEGEYCPECGFQFDAEVKHEGRY
jgi:hypothetical protein